jgi:hypothetical protein
MKAQGRRPHQGRLQDTYRVWHKRGGMPGTKHMLFVEDQRFMDDPKLHQELRGAVDALGPKEGRWMRVARGFPAYSIVRCPLNDPKREHPIRWKEGEKWVRVAAVRIMRKSQ